MKRKSCTVDRLRQAEPQPQRHLPLVDLLVDTRAELMELAVASGLKVLQQIGTSPPFQRRQVTGSSVAMEHAHTLNTYRLKPGDSNSD